MFVRHALIVCVYFLSSGSHTGMLSQLQSIFFLCDRRRQTVLFRTSSGNIDPRSGELAGENLYQVSRRLGVPGSFTLPPSRPRRSWPSKLRKRTIQLGLP